MIKKYYRIMLGQKSKHADVCYKNKWIGGHYGFNESLENKFLKNKQEFNKINIPIYLKNHPGSKKHSAALSCGMLYTICKGINKGDIVVCPDGDRNYWIGEVISDYYFKDDEKLIDGESMPHRRNVEWFDTIIERDSMSEILRNSTGSIGTVSEITQHKDEIENFLKGQKINKVFSSDKSVINASQFAIEADMRDYLVKNWSKTEFYEKYNICTDENGEIIGKEYPIGDKKNWRIDILAISKDEKEYLVIELKKGREGAKVVGQILKYMGAITKTLLEGEQTVKGVIIAFEEDEEIKNALVMSDKIDYYRYELDFKLYKVDE